MSKPVIYGIKNCDTVKKALVWLEAHNVACDFHDYKKQGADRAVLARAFRQYGWENVLNRKGTSWRALPETVRENMDAAGAMAAALANPSLIRRPLVVVDNEIIVGFDEEVYRERF